MSENRENEKQGVAFGCPNSCIDCGVFNCGRQDKKYPDFCLTTGLTKEEYEELEELYHDPINQRIAVASAEVEGAFYQQLTRVEETMEFAKRIGAKKLGIASCVGLIQESKLLAKILRLNGFEVYGAACKVGAMKKTETVGLDEAYTCQTGNVMCNPIAQAKLLAKQGVDLNIMMGLCCGHDSLFLKYAKGPTTVLVVKDRVLGNNPVQALYQASAYYKRLLMDPKQREEYEKKKEEADRRIAEAEKKD
ncbi:MAG: DUF1847 domain-containing protein [Fusicatenibacter sp.]|nr:DUF1847 domain-containing protein [Lachnospiraceae bacterium]MDY2937786.1 DUF1847 domain-containing protein [Fusicatenibacter sp.]